MQIDDQLISRLEHLSRLKLSTEERKTIKQDLDNILGMVEKLQELELDDVAPLAYVNEVQHRLRADIVQGQVDRADALHNAPATDGEHFQVPKVIDLGTD